MHFFSQITTLIILFTSPLISLEYGILAKKEGCRRILRCSVYSERCSGSNYLKDLVQKNFAISFSQLGYKHFPPWFDLPLDHYSQRPELYTFENTDNYLFIVIFRNPYDWSRSLNINPWHADKSLCRKPFSDFIRKVWFLNSNEKDVINLQKYDPLADCNPIDGSHFNNIFELRTAKIKNMLKIKDKAKNVYYVNYESLRDFPEEVFNEIISIYNIPKKASYFTQSTLYKGITGTKYQPKEYKPITLEDLEYINSQLDEALENEIGYNLILDPDQL